MTFAIEADGLKKRFGDTQALDGVDLAARQGSVLGVLGPNGAGKTTAVRILATLIATDEGTARVAGHDVAREPAKVRELIGLTGQYASVDELLTGEQNLVMIGQLLDLSGKQARVRAKELLDWFDLSDAANRPAKTYSGGMRRRLDLAVSLIATPPIIFLDEPTTGLDPRSRQSMWGIIKNLLAGGTTILLTTQYLEEADQLADNIVVIDGGKVIAEGSASELKSKVGKDRLELTFASARALQQAVELLGKAVVDTNEKENNLTTVITDTNKDVKDVLEKLNAAKVTVASLNVHKPTLDDVFLSLTGKQKAHDEAEAEEK